MFSILVRTNFNKSVTFILSSATAFHLDQSEILSTGKGLRKYQENHWELGDTCHDFCEIVSLQTSVSFFLGYIAALSLHPITNF